MKPKVAIPIAIAALFVLPLGIWACFIVSDGITTAAFSKVQDSKPALTTDQVTYLLGQPSHIEQSESTGVKGEVYYYPWHDNEMKIVLVNGTVFHAEYTTEKKS